jgi:pimeloyl-ACP methyl ester carboxylesterase
MTLHFKQFGQGFPLLILHGLFGSSDNWQTLAKTLAKEQCAILPDLRNHGQSPHNQEWSYEAMADDIIELCNTIGLERINLAGHSMGGKTALCIAAKKPELIHKLMIIDIGPKYYPPHHQGVFEAIDAAEATGLQSRKEAEIAMMKALPETGTVQFLLKNLYWKTTEKLGWRFNLPVIRENIEIVGAANNLEGFSPNIPIMFLRGEHSHYVKEEDMEEILTKIPKAVFRTISGAGHWLHADNPSETVSAMEAWFRK